LGIIRKLKNIYLVYTIECSADIVLNKKAIFSVRANEKNDNFALKIVNYNGDLKREKK
jgi:hypothetical protein